MQYLGVPYVWGGVSSSGFDCSGFTMYVYAQIGVALPHYTGAQYAIGVAVPRSQLQPGDLVFFDGLGHEGMYIGNNQFIHAPHTGDVVKISGSLAGGPLQPTSVRAGSDATQVARQGHGQHEAHASLNPTAFAATWTSNRLRDRGSPRPCHRHRIRWGNVASIAIAVALAFFFGYLLTLRPLATGGDPVREASPGPPPCRRHPVGIAVMEIVDNGFILLVPGAMEAGLGDFLLWGGNPAISLFSCLLGGASGQPCLDPFWRGQRPRAPAYH